MIGRQFLKTSAIQFFREYNLSLPPLIQREQIIQKHLTPSLRTTTSMKSTRLVCESGAICEGRLNIETCGFQRVEELFDDRAQPIKLDNAARLAKAGDFVC